MTNIYPPYDDEDEEEIAYITGQNIREDEFGDDVYTMLDDLADYVDNDGDDGVRHICPKCNGTGIWIDDIEPCDHCDGLGYEWWLS